jgi:hypothetical protein
VRRVVLRLDTLLVDLLVLVLVLVLDCFSVKG